LVVVLWIGLPVAALGVEDAVAVLERERDRSPGNVETRGELGKAYYQRARHALDEERFDDYQRDLGRALDEWIEALRLDPESPSSHTWMGIVAIYQGDLDSALRSFANARRLNPRSWVSYTNIAETMIYRGKLDGARKFLRRGEHLRADPAVVEINLCLLEWRQGDLDDARYHFQEAYHLSPETVNTWNEAPITEPLRTFHDLTRYCCGSPSCGPYMGDACKKSNLEVTERVVPEEVARQELVLEMERRRKLKEIYDRRRDLGVEVEGEDEPEQRRGLEIDVEEEGEKKPAAEVKPRPL
jgi:tetratricopeptide (TPR) repeat protein